MRFRACIFAIACVFSVTFVGHLYRPYVWLYNADLKAVETVPEPMDSRPSHLKSAGLVVEVNDSGTKSEPPNQYQTSDNWPTFSKPYFSVKIPKSPFKPTFTIKWDFNTSAFLERPDVKGKPPKIITWMVKSRYIPNLPEPVRLRVCPEMPCLMTTNKAYQKESAALLWDGQIMRDRAPPHRTHPDQVFVFHNNEPQKPDWNHGPPFRNAAWKAAFNWTLTYRFDSDIVCPYGHIVKRSTPAEKNYTAIMAKKTDKVVWLCSHCNTFGQREAFVASLKKRIQVDVYGGCGPYKCPRSSDDRCIGMLSEKYKFLLAFENAFCTDYASEKFFRYVGSDTDLVVVARGSNEYQKHSPPGIFINTADFDSVKALADHLLYLDSHPDEYVKLLKAKHQYQALYSDWPIRDGKGKISFMEYDYETVSHCELCRRLWDLDKHRKVIPDIVSWFDKGNCYPPPDLNKL